MRWMRELSWRQWLLVIPAVAVLAFGIRYTARSISNSRQVASNSEGGKSAKGKGAKRDVASSKKKDGEGETYSAADDAELHDQLQVAIDKIGEDKGVPVEKDMPPVAKAPAPDSTVPGQCGTTEIRGDGPVLTKVTPEEWAMVMAEFHGVKKNLLTWLEHNKGKFPPKTYELMEKQIQDVKLQRPPVAEEPDLAWRGVAVLGKDLEGDPMIRMGNGFLKLLVREPDRGKFELARLAAQTRAPCEFQKGEFQKAQAGTPWGPLVKCLGIDEPNACGAGTYSEAGWAVSTVLAYKVANPGCTVPALVDPSVAACVNEIPFTSTAAAAASRWTEAHR